MKQQAHSVAPPIRRGPHSTNLADDAGNKSLNNMGVIGHRRDLFKMNGITQNKSSNLTNAQKQPTSLATVARIYE